ncbi:TRAP-type transport system, periplasmic component, predicted N-acetylneuraminate-binding protein [plant metagenome]|uniref:TRAP-type transport system, periplasmic component, predicted N-acetylneuraminate-binding protein n=1 Tax=plant metagenome TaxID=1297885 RepID=A0A484TDQ9_9ZZZZ
MHKKPAGLWLVALSALFAAQVSAQDKPKQMRMSTTVAENSHYGDLVHKFADEVKRLTNGRYQIQGFHAGALGGEREAIEAVQLGTQELTLSSTGPVPNFVPEARILDVPFLFRDYDHARKVLDGPIGQKMLSQFEPKGMKALGWCDNGFRHMTNSRRAVNAPADLKGLKMRTMENPVHIQAYKAFGIIPTPMSFTEVFTALQQGTVDGQENPLSIIQSNKLDQVQKYMSLTGHVFSPCVVLMSMDAWKGLSAEDQKAFQEAAKAGIAANRARVDKDEREAVAALQKNGMQIVTDVDKTAYQAALADVYKQFAKQFGQDKLDEIRNVQ